MYMYDHICTIHMHFIKLLEYLVSYDIDNGHIYGAMSMYTTAVLATAPLAYSVHIVACVH